MPLASVNWLTSITRRPGAARLRLLLRRPQRSTPWVGRCATSVGGALPRDRLRQPRCGRSSAPPGPYTTRQMADDAAALLAHLGIDHAHVIGQSMGGMIAQELALAHPERVDRLVLDSTIARPRLATFGPWLSIWENAAKRGLDASELALSLMPWMFTPAFMTQHDQVEAALVEWASDPYPAPAHGSPLRPPLAEPTMPSTGCRRSPRQPWFSSGQRTSSFRSPVRENWLRAFRMHVCTCSSAAATSRMGSTRRRSPRQY